MLRKHIKFGSFPYLYLDRPSVGFITRTKFDYWMGQSRKKFHAYFYSGTGEKKIIDLTNMR
jgi:hypothetical protein